MTRDATLASARPLVMSPEPAMKSHTTQSPPSHSPTRLPPSCLRHIFSFLSRSNQLHAALTCRAWSTPALELIWAHFKFVREREFDSVFAIASRRTASHPYGTFIKSLELIHSERDFPVTPNVVFLITHLCTHLESIAISFNHSRPVAPPVMPNRPVLPPITRPGEPPHRPLSPARPQANHAHHSETKHHHPTPPQPLPQQQLHQQQQRQSIPFNHSLPLAHFGLNCRKLRSIKLTSYLPKTDDSVYEMAKYMQSGTLESISFSGCATLQGSTLCKLAMTNPQLRHIEIMGNTPVSDSSLATLAERCGPNLESLSIGNAYHLTDRSVRHLAKRCPNLRRVCLFNNPDGNRLTEAALSDLVHRCTRLELLSLSNVRALGVDFFTTIANRVESDLGSIERGEVPAQFGLQRVCFGGLRREVIQSAAMARLIRQSASRNNPVDSDDDDCEGDFHDMTTMLGRLPKTSVIRGSSMWWHRRLVNH